MHNHVVSLARVHSEHITSLELSRIADWHGEKSRRKSGEESKRHKVIEGELRKRIEEMEDE